MLVSPRYNGIEIPVFSPETDVIGDMKTADIDPTKGSIVRACEVSEDMGMHFDSLTEFLEATDKELKEAAEACSASVIPHRWGLYELDPDNPDSGLSVYEDLTETHDITLSPILPDGFILVAEIPVVINVSSELNIWHKQLVKAGICKYIQSKRPGDFIYDDNSLEQYASGVMPNDKEGKRKLMLLDVDPIIERILSISM